MTGQSQRKYGGPLEDGCDEPSNTAVEAFLFGPYRAIPYARLLECAGSPVPISSRAFDLLCILVKRAGKLVSKCELMANTWPDITVAEGSLRFHIRLLRRALEEGQESNRYVVNIPGRGYCFVARVSREELGPPSQRPCSGPGLTEVTTKALQAAPTRSRRTPHAQ